MGWNSPATRVTGELITAAIWNSDIADNLNYLLNRPSGQQNADEVSNYSTSSTGFVDIDSTDLALTVETHAGVAYVHFEGSIKIAGSGSELGYLEVVVDGVQVAGDSGIMCIQRSTNFNDVYVPFSFTRRVPGLSNGSHVFKVQWKVSAGTATLTIAAGTGSAPDIHPQFWVKEG